MQLNKLRLSHKQQALAMLEVSDSPSKSASARCTGPGIEAITKIIANIQKLIHIVSRDCVVKSCQIDVWDNISEYIYISYDDILCKSKPTTQRSSKKKKLLE